MVIHPTSSPHQGGAALGGGVSTGETETAALPPALAEIAEDFTGLEVKQRLQLLLEFSDDLPPLPDRYAGHVELMEQVDECQSPVFLVVEVSLEGQDGEPGADGEVRLYFQAPAESPTTRGFAGILSEGLSGLRVSEVLAVPDDAPYRFGLAEAVSPLRLRGMVAMLSRIKRQVRLKSTGAGQTEPS
jgi:cysteine desulfuration protein SufE